MKDFKSRIQKQTLQNTSTLRDVRRGLITETALQRLKKDSDTLQSIPTDTRSKYKTCPQYSYQTQPRNNGRRNVIGRRERDPQDKAPQTPKKPTPTTAAPPQTNKYKITFLKSRINLFGGPRTPKTSQIYSLRMGNRKTSVCLA